MTYFGGPGKGLDMYHVGVTVPDLSAAMELYSAAFGFGWATVRESAPEVVVDGERRSSAIAVTYSIQGPPHLELVQELRGGIWAPDALALTHVGFWTEDLAAGMRALEESGLAARVHDAGADGRPARYSYHSFAGGLWVELVHTSFKKQLAGWIADTLAGSG